ncbi:hypothetical protein HDU93_003536 [Gonapodya sp. JEL0774]|nr:hypothetical protein HDU93_003536 [Gonapodya sp. JEL0774]
MLEYVDLSENGLINGTIPESINRIITIKGLLLAFNSLSGSIPVMDRLTQLGTLNLSGNGNLSGSVPSLVSHPNLKVVDLSKNSLSGTITKSSVAAPKLNLLDLSTNQLTGHLPSLSNTINNNFAVSGSSTSQPGIARRSWWPYKTSRLTPRQYQYQPGSNTNTSNITLPANLTILRLSWNNLDGVIEPTWVSSWPSLKILDLSSNYFRGGIPGEAIAKLTRVEVIDLSHNRLNGSMPPTLWKPTITELRLSNNDLSGSIPANVSKLTSCRVLDLSENRISGEIPYDIYKAGNLTVLDISQNNLTGSVPDSISNITTLNNLSLAGNQGISGELPQRQLQPDLLTDRRELTDQVHNSSVRS